MQIIARDYKDYIYDPAILGYDTGFFKTVTGAADPTISSNKIRLNAHKIASYSNHLKGFLEMILNFGVIRYMIISGLLG